MKRRDVITLSVAIAGCATTCFASYFGGRDLIIPLLLPPGTLPVLVTILALLLFVAFDFTWPPPLGKLAVKSALILAIYWVLNFPSNRGDGYFAMGRRAHVKAVFTPEAIAHIRSIVTTQIASNPTEEFGHVEMANLPSLISESAWGLPGSISFRHEQKSKRTVIELSWGGPLIAHHGLVIVDPPETEGPKKDLSYYQIVEELYPGAYIFNSWH
jgi:hypothetical protein